ncbi:hypothetical protein [Cerasicoccus maritimus]|uniref:hypothetical protein n=1 Tax=Cerasicoccus maritimus TaxID=490089 RepID=UPI0028524FF2|nr:hypothetical protein [Cerasicoccus maritimus]
MPPEVQVSYRMDAEGAFPAFSELVRSNPRYRRLTAWLKYGCVIGFFIFAGFQNNWGHLSYNTQGERYGIIGQSIGLVVLFGFSVLITYVGGRIWSSRMDKNIRQQIEAMPEEFFGEITLRFDAEKIEVSRQDSTFSVPWSDVGEARKSAHYFHLTREDGALIACIPSGSFQSLEDMDRIQTFAAQVRA